LSWPKFLLFGIFGSVGAGVAEELLFRGYLQQRLVKRLGAVPGILLASLFFGAFHIYPGHMFPTFFMGIVLGSLAYASRSVWPGVIAHTINNAISFAELRALGAEPESTMPPLFLLVAGAVAVSCVVVLFRAARRRAIDDAVVKAQLTGYASKVPRASLPAPEPIPIAAAQAASMA
jgi:membrane protease YdiL (CAAX protease family)